MLVTLMDSFYCYNKVTFECFKMQMVINLAPVSLSNKKVNFYTCPRLTFLKKNATENAYKSISEPLDFKLFLGGMLPEPPSSSRLILGDPGADSGGEGKSKTFLRAIFFCPFRLSSPPLSAPASPRMLAPPALESCLVLF